MCKYFTQVQWYEHVWFLPPQTNVEILQIISDENETNYAGTGENVKIKVRGVEEEVSMSFSNVKGIIYDFPSLNNMSYMTLHTTGIYFMVYKWSCKILYVKVVMYCLKIVKDLLHRLLCCTVTCNHRKYNFHRYIDSECVTMNMFTFLINFSSTWTFWEFLKLFNHTVKLWF